jgi:hypothetical protein
MANFSQSHLYLPDKGCLALTQKISLPNRGEQEVAFLAMS